jgi:hypothetical protein
MHDARILAAPVGDPGTITRTTTGKWVRDFRASHQRELKPAKPQSRPVRS